MCLGNLDRKIPKARARKARILSPGRALAESKRVSPLPCPSSQWATDFLTPVPHLFEPPGRAGRPGGTETTW